MDRIRGLWRGGGNKCGESNSNGSRSNNSNAATLPLSPLFQCVCGRINSLLLTPCVSVCLRSPLRPSRSCPPCTFPSLFPHRPLFLLLVSPCFSVSPPICLSRSVACRCVLCVQCRFHEFWLCEVCCACAVFVVCVLLRCDCVDAPERCCFVLCCVPCAVSCLCCCSVWLFDCYPSICCYVLLMILFPHCEEDRTIIFLSLERDCIDPFVL